MNAAEIAKALKGHRSRHGYVVRCPAHDDRNLSLSIRDGYKADVVVKCFAGCTSADVIAALFAMGLWAKARGRGKIQRHVHPAPRHENRTDDRGSRDRIERALDTWRESIRRERWSKPTLLQFEGVSAR
jgi:putative DNA primase/helicase